MKLHELVSGIECRIARGSTDINIEGITSDSRNVVENGLFIAIRGAVSDGHEFIKTAADKGAKAFIIEDENFITDIPEGSSVLVTTNTRLALALASAAFYGHPSDKLFVIGITGTKGKTTTTYMIRNVLESCGIKTGLIGTIETIIGDEVTPAKNTTPESIKIQEDFARMVEAGCAAVVMEVSSQGLKLDRTAGIMFDIGVFTNLGLDHIGPDEHDSFEEYLECKSRLFRQCRLGIVNGDDEHAESILKGHTCKRVIRFGQRETNDIYASDINLFHERGRIGLTYVCNGLCDLKPEVHMPGLFTVYNSLCAIAVTKSLCVTDSGLRLMCDADSACAVDTGMESECAVNAVMGSACAVDTGMGLTGGRYETISDDKLLAALLNVHVRGRMEPVKVSDDFSVMIDYAHNAMALSSILEDLRQYKPNRLVCVFGCGGNRSKDRRFEMGRVSGELADFTVITSDNPRYENPDDIMSDIESTLAKTGGDYIKIKDRAGAVKYAIGHGQPGDIIIIAGKGHEDYQEINGVRHHMDERELVRDAVRQLIAEGVSGLYAGQL